MIEDINYNHKGVKYYELEFSKLTVRINLLFY